jgi:tetratricopeptide (TPR) repeat protein
MLAIETRFLLDHDQRGRPPVLRGIDRLTGRPVAIKQGNESDEILREEFATGLSLSVPGVVETLDLTTAIAHGGQPKLARPALIQGWVEGDPWPTSKRPWREILGRLASLLANLAEIHRRGWLHLDLTPNNLKVRGEQVTILDLGHARRPSQASRIARLHGTRAYIAPELLRQIDGVPLQEEKIVYSADIWQVGVLVFQSLTGVSPEERPEDTSIRWSADLDVALRGEPAAVILHWNEFLGRCLSDTPAHRYPNAEWALSALNALFSTRFLPHPPRFDIGAFRPRWISLLLRRLGRSTRRAPCCHFHCWGPPGSGRSSLLRTVAGALRLHGWRLAWWEIPAGESAPHLLGDVDRNNHSPLLILCDVETTHRAPPPLADWEKARGSSRLLLLSTGDTPLREDTGGWLQRSVPVPRVPPASAARWLRRHGLLGHTPLLHGGHPLLLQSEAAQPDLALEERVATWIADRQGVPRHRLSLEAARWLITAAAPRSSPHHEYEPWRHLLSSPGVAAVLARELPPEERLRLDYDHPLRERHCAWQTTRCVLLHAELGDRLRAHRRFRRQIAALRHADKPAAEWEWIRCGIDQGILSLAAWGRRLRLSRRFNRSATAQAHEKQQALAALPTSSAIVWQLRCRRLATLGLLPLDDLWKEAAAHPLLERHGSTSMSFLLLHRIPWGVAPLLSSRECCRQIATLLNDSGLSTDNPLVEAKELLLTVCHPHGASSLSQEALDGGRRTIRALLRKAIHWHRAGQMRWAVFFSQLATRLAANQGSPRLAFSLAIRQLNFALLDNPWESLNTELINLCSLAPALRLESAQRWLKFTKEQAHALEKAGNYPEAATFHSALGIAYLRSGDVMKAQAHLTRVLAARPPHLATPAIFNLTTAALYRGQIERAESTLREFEQLLSRLGADLDRDHGFQVQRASIELANNQPERALKRTSRILNGDDNRQTDVIFDAWQITIRCYLATSNWSGLAATLKAAPHRPPHIPNTDVDRVLALLWAVRGHARLGQLQRSTPELVELHRSASVSEFAEAAHFSARAELMEEQGNRNAATRFRTFADQRFDRLGWGYPVRSNSALKA